MTPTSQVQRKNPRRVMCVRYLKIRCYIDLKHTPIIIYNNNNSNVISCAVSEIDSVDFSYLITLFAIHI